MIAEIHPSSFILHPAPSAVTIRELIKWLGKSKQAWVKMGDRERWTVLNQKPRVYALASLPADLRERIARERTAEENRVAGTAGVDKQDACPTQRSDKLPADFSEGEQRLGRERARFVQAVWVTKRERPSLTLKECCRAVAIAAKSDLTGKWAELTTAGKDGRSAIAPYGLDPASDKFPAYSNFEVWDRRLRPFRRNEEDISQWWVCCDRNAERREKLAGKYQRNGDERFWEEFRAHFVNSKHWTFEQSYREAVGEATRNGWACATQRQVAYYYMEKICDKEKRGIFKIREGRKRHYDERDIYIIRDWHRVEPDDCWSFDGHKLVRKGWMAERPWLVNAIDSCSWFELGRHFTMVPAQDSVEYAIRDALIKHHRIAALFYFDNGREFKAAGRKLVTDEKRLDEVCRNLSVEAMYALPYNPRAKVNERDYRCVVSWFESGQPTYLGNAAINKSNFDQRWHDLHRPGAPLETDARGCLLNWHLVPELQDIAAQYDRYRAMDHHERVRTGRICPGQSPAAKYMGAEPKRLLEEGEIALSFLREIGRQKVDSQPRVRYRPPGCRAGEEMYFEDEALMGFRDRHVVVKFDVAAMRCFVFEERAGGDLKQIKCAGEFGSVPRYEGLHPFRATQEDIRGKKRTYSRWQRTEREGLRAGNLNDAARELSGEIATEHGITPGQARVYVLKPDDVVARAEDKQQKRNELQKAFADVDEEEERRYLRGAATEEIK
jgi:hypothetical protein